MLSNGTEISYYRILDHLGSGGMGEVYLAEDARLSRRVALKLLPAEFTREPDRVRRFELEARAASALNHPGIVTIHDIGRTDGSHFIVTEFIDGATLRERLLAPPIPVPEAIEIAAQVAAAVGAAHDAGIVHRDIKPENIMVRRDGYVKVLDFGLAKLTEPERPTEESQTRTAASGGTAPGLVLGTVAYMSPEQARGLPLDARTDVFSLGVVLYEMVAGRTPFAGPTASDVIASILARDPPPLARYADELPGELERIVTRALAKNRDERYQTIKDLALDLKNLKQEVELEYRQRRASGTSARQAEVSGARAPSGSSRPLASDPQMKARQSLPAHPTPLIGRADELATAESLLRDPSVRLLSLTGAGGTGKTRLALQIAADLLQEFESGAFFVSLAPISDPNLVPSAIAQTLEIKDLGGFPLLENLRQTLRENEMLLVLDNFEQVLPAAPLVAELLTACPRLKVLVTSRAVLHLRGERELAIQPLPLPDLSHLPPVEALPEYSSVLLFLERARMVAPDFALTPENARTVAEICARLDGLPLAIELAAARVRHLTPQALLARLKSRLKLLTSGPRDLPARQQTIRSAIAWSNDLLEPGEKKLFRRLSVFVGGLTIEAAEAVSGAADPEIDVDPLEGIASLVDKSLLFTKTRPDGGVRYLMLETVREYGLEQLTLHNESAETRRLHASFFLDLAERAEPQLTGPDQKSWLDRLEREHDNLRASIQWAAETESVEIALRLAAALWRFWLVRGHLTEGRERLALLLALGGAEPSPFRARALMGAGSLAQNQGDYDVARTLFEEALTVWRQLGNEPGIASALTNLGWVAWRRGDYESARSLTEEGLVLHRKLEDARGVAYSLNNLGWIAHHQGDYDAACALHEETLSLRREFGDKRGIAFSLSNLGYASYKRGNAREGARLLEESAALFREVGEKQLLAMTLIRQAEIASDEGKLESAGSLLDTSVKLTREIGAKYSLAYALGVLGNTFKQRGEAARAASLYEESLALRREMGDAWGAAVALNELADLSQSAGDAVRATSLYEESLAIRNRLGDRHGIAQCLAGLADVAASEDRSERAARLLAAAERLYETTGAARPPAERDRDARTERRLRERLGADRFTALSKEGRELAPDEASAFALGRKASVG